MKRNPKYQVPTTLTALQRNIEKSQFEKEVKLPPSYKVKAADVMCVDRGSSKDCNNHAGNNRLRVMIDLRLERYKQAATRREKSEIVKEIVVGIRSMGGGFIYWRAGEWYDIGNSKAREKVSNAIRAALRKNINPDTKITSTNSNDNLKRGITTTCMDTASTEHNWYEIDDCTGNDDSSLSNLVSTDVKHRAKFSIDNELDNVITNQEKRSAAMPLEQKWYQIEDCDGDDDLVLSNMDSAEANQRAKFDLENELDKVLTNQKKMSGEPKASDP